MVGAGIVVGTCALKIAKATAIAGNERLMVSDHTLQKWTYGRRVASL